MLWEEAGGTQTIWQSLELPATEHQLRLPQRRWRFFLFCLVVFQCYAFCQREIQIPPQSSGEGADK